MGLFDGTSSSAAPTPTPTPPPTAQPSFSSAYGPSYYVGSIQGIRVHVSVYLPLVTLFFSLGGALHRGGLAFAENFLIYGPLLFLVVLLHEYGHCLVARRQGAAADEILLWPLGGLAFVSKLDSAEADMKVAIGGPALQSPVILLFLLLLAAANQGSVLASTIPTLEENFFARLFWDFMILNCFFIFFNLFIPCWPLDGGRILVDILLLRGYSVEQAALAVILTSLPIIGTLLAVSLWMLLNGLFTAVTWGVMGVYLAVQTINLYRCRVSPTMSTTSHPLFHGRTGSSGPRAQSVYDAQEGPFNKT